MAYFRRHGSETRRWGCCPASKFFGFPPSPSKTHLPKSVAAAHLRRNCRGQRPKMNKIISGTVTALGLAGAVFVAPVSAADVVGVRVGDVGLRFTIGNGHYYDRHHHRPAHGYPSDWKTYHHRQNLVSQPSAMERPEPSRLVSQLGLPRIDPALRHCAGKLRQPE